MSYYDLPQSLRSGLFNDLFRSSNPLVASYARVYAFDILRAICRIVALVSLAAFAYRALLRDNEHYAMVCVGWGAQFIYYWRLEDRYPTVNLKQKDRMEAYAALKPGSEADLIPLNLERTSKIAYEVLLGTLKKVEAKSASLLVVWTLFASSVFVVITTLPSNQDELKAGLVAFVLFCLPTVVLLTKCFRQLDFLDLPVGYKTSPGEMQSYLFLDLSEKERYYRFAQKMTVIVAWTCGFLLVIWIEALTR